MKKETVTGSVIGDAALLVVAVLFLAVSMPYAYCRIKWIERKKHLA